MDSGKWLTMAGLATAEPSLPGAEANKDPSVVTKKPAGGRMSAPEQLPSQKRQSSALLKHSYSQYSTFPRL